MEILFHKCELTGDLAERGVPAALYSAAVGEMIRGRAGLDRLSSAFVERVIERTDGVPLFVEEFTKAMKEKFPAVKVLAAHLDGEELMSRLGREARILATLEHPGIVPVFDLGIE